MSRKQLLKLKAELDAFDLKSQQNILELLSINLQIQKNQLEALSIWFEMEKEVERPIISVEEHPSRESNEVDFNLPPVFDDYGEEETEEKVPENKEGEHILEEEENKEEPQEVLKVEKEEEVEEANGGSHIPHSKANVPAPMCDLFFTSSEPLSKATYPKLTSFKELVFNDPKQLELPFSNHPITFPQNHSIRTKQDLFAWLILFQPLTSPYHPPYCPMFSFLCFKPLTQKFCHKDKWKEPTLAL